MNNKNISVGELKKETKLTESVASSSQEVIEPKAQMLEIDVLKETINVLKKIPASIKQLSATGRRQ